MDKPRENLQNRAKFLLVLPHLLPHFHPEASPSVSRTTMPQEASPGDSALTSWLCLQLCPAHAIPPPKQFPYWAVPNTHRTLMHWTSLNCQITHQPTCPAHCLLDAASWVPCPGLRSSCLEEVSSVVERRAGDLLWSPALPIPLTSSACVLSSNCFVPLKVKKSEKKEQGASLWGFFPQVITYSKNYITVLDIYPHVYTHTIQALLEWKLYKVTLLFAIFMF